MAQLCREFGISRKTGYKIYDRYKECGIYGLADRISSPTVTESPVSFMATIRKFHGKRETVARLTAAYLHGWPKETASQDV